MNLSGPLLAKKADSSTKALSLKSAVEPGDTLISEKGTYARIKFVDDSEITLLPNSQLKIDDFSFDEDKLEKDSAGFSLVKGGLRAVTGTLGKRNKEKWRMNTPTATIGIRGTHLGALFCQNDCGGVPTPTGKTPENGLHVDVASGAIVVTPKPMPQLAPSSAAPVPNGAPSAATSTPAASRQATPPPASSPPAVVLNAGQFGYLPPPQNGVQPPLVLVPPNHAVQIQVPQSINQTVQIQVPQSIIQNNSTGAATSKNAEKACVW
jgi:FecR protein